MALNDAGLVVAANAVDAVIAYFSLHSSGGVGSSANETSAARVAVNGSVDADGDITWTGPYNFTGGAASGACIRVGYWTASSGGTYYGGTLMTGDQTFNAAGEYTVNSVVETGTAA